MVPIVTQLMVLVYVLLVSQESDVKVEYAQLSILVQNVIRYASVNKTTLSFVIPGREDVNACLDGQGIFAVALVHLLLTD